MVGGGGLRALLDSGGGKSLYAGVAPTRDSQIMTAVTHVSPNHRLVASTITVNQ